MNISLEKQIGLPAIVLPMLILLCWAVPWEGDPRTRPVLERFFHLKKSTWPWDQAEYRRMLDTIDVNQLVDGVPLFVKLAIETKDQEMLQRMLARGADVNSSNWGCTPMLRALEMDKASATDIQNRDPDLTLLVLRAGANPALRPSLESVERRLATGVPKDACTEFDELLKMPQASTLRIVAQHSQNKELLELLVQKGARLSDQADAQAFLQAVVRSWLYNDIGDDLVTLARSYGASLDDAFQSRVTFDLSTSTAIGSAISQGPDGIKKMLKQGADPNRRLTDGTLPLQLAIARCASVRSIYNNERYDEANRFMYEIMADEWRKGDQEARKSNAGTLQLIATLLEAGANPNLPLMPDGQGGSILAYAVRQCSSDVPRLLLTYKARVDSEAIKAARFDVKALLQSHAGSQ